MANKHDDRLGQDCLGSAVLAGFGTAVLCAIAIVTVHGVGTHLYPPETALAVASPTVLLWGTAFLGTFFVARHARRSHVRGARIAPLHVARCVVAFAMLALTGPSLGCLCMADGDLSPFLAHMLLAERLVQVAATLAFAGLMLARNQRDPADRVGASR